MTLENKYFIKTSENGEYTDVTTLVDGVRVLKVDGMFNIGEAVNVYNQQWVDGQAEDFLITSHDDYDNPVVIRKNVDISVTFIVGERYASDPSIDVATAHDTFTSLLTSGDIWVRSSYAGKQVHCVCLENYEPETVKLHRNGSSYIIGTIKLHCLDKPDDV